MTEPLNNDSRERRKDPSPNVIDLVEAAIQRQDDLREQENQHQEQAHLHTAEMADLRAEYDNKLRRAESDRLDAIRAVDVGNVAAAAVVSATQAATLAAQVVTSAETLRNQVAATATASTVALAAALDPIQKAIEDLRRSQYEAQGQKETVVDRREVTGLRNQGLGVWVAGASGLIAFASVIVALIVKG